MAERLTDRDEIRELVRERYAEAARGLSEPAAARCCGGGAEVSADCCGPSSSPLGCGNPTAIAELHEGEIVLDLGSGDGTDVLLSADRVGGTGRAYGLDMTDEMLQLARANAARAGANVDFLKGTIESIPLPDDSVDVVISNCVLNLSTDKASAFAEAARVLRPGGRLAVTDVVADPEMDEETRADLEAWTGCIAGALTEADLRRHLEAAGFTGIEVRETHRVHDHAGSAIIRARMPEHV